jgi:DNA-binding transcriptional LysR family regulator
VPQNLSGEFIVTSLYVVTPMLMPVLNAFQAQHPNIVVRYVASDRLFRLEYGEAHVAVRTGPKPDQPDTVVQLFTTIRLGLYANADYVTRHGIPKTMADFSAHSFVGSDHPSSKSPFNTWLQAQVPASNLVFRSNSPLVLEQAIRSGTGIGFMATHRASQHPDLTEVWPHQDEWDVPFWLVTHADLHQTAKVQTFLALLDSDPAPWQGE